MTRRGHERGTPEVRGPLPKANTLLRLEFEPPSQEQVRLEMLLGVFSQIQRVEIDAGSDADHLIPSWFFGSLSPAIIFSPCNRRTK